MIDGIMSPDFWSRSVTYSASLLTHLVSVVSARILCDVCWSFHGEVVVSNGILWNIIGIQWGDFLILWGYFVILFCDI
jgi:hypothetical protein